MIALLIFLSILPFFSFTIAAAFLIIAIDLITIGLTKKSPISKCLLDLWVEAPQYLLFGTFIFPKLSNSYLNFIFYNNIHKISETKAIIKIRILTPNRYLAIFTDELGFFPFPAPKEITK